MFAFYKNWMEFFFLVLMIIGVFIALTAPSAMISYFIMFISGMFAGRLMYERQHKIGLPYLIIIAGFVIGYLLGAYYGNKGILISLFIIGALITYKLYEKKVLRDIQY